MVEAKASIVVAVYNTEKYLEKCLNSIKNQSYKNLEVILVNDGSTDSSGEILKKYAQNDNRFRVFEQKNQGPGAAKNLGLKKATGDYLIFVDSDDWIDKEFIERLIIKAEQENLDMVFCDYIAETENGTKIRTGKLSQYENRTLEDIIKLHMTGRMPCGASKKIIKNDLIKKSGACFTTVTSGEEFKYTLKALLEAKNVGFTKDVYYHYLQRECSQSRKKHDFTENITVLKDVLEEQNLFEKYKDIYYTTIIACTIIEIYNCCEENRFLMAIKEAKKIIKKYKDKYKEEYKVNDIRVEYTDKKIQMMYPFFRMNLIFILVLSSKIYNISKKLKNNPI